MGLKFYKECPKCGARASISKEHIAGVLVKCSSCGYYWRLGSA